MTGRDRDPIAERLAPLRALTPDPLRAERVRTRCRARIAARERRSTRREVSAGLGRRVLTRAVVLGLGALYVASLVGTALEFLNPVLHNGQLR
jgi:hypothetical protein